MSLATNCYKKRLIVVGKITFRYTGTKIHILTENSHVQNHIIQEIHIFKIELHISKIHNCKIIFFNKNRISKI